MIILYYVYIFKFFFIYLFYIVSGQFLHADETQHRRVKKKIMTSECKLFSHYF